ncbi:hypothetical protein [Rhodococcus sp. 24CO]
MHNKLTSTATLIIAISRPAILAGLALVGWPINSANKTHTAAWASL